MSIDPGEGYRLIEPHEILERGDQFFNEASNCWSHKVSVGHCPISDFVYRRRIDLKKPTGDAVESDPVNHPEHYTSHPSGVECIQITEHMGFNLGNAMKYIWRADLKGNAIEDLRKARYYLDREIAKRGEE